MSNVTRKPAKEDKWESPRGTLVISQPVRGVVLFTYDGYMVADVVPFIESTVNEVFALGIRPDLFIDVWNMTGYDSLYRKNVTNWGSRYSKLIGENHFLVRSKLIAMGIAMSNLMSESRFKSTTRRAEFQDRLDAAIARHAAAT